MGVRERIVVLHVARRGEKREPWLVKLGLDQYEVSFVLKNGRVALMGKHKPGSRGPV